MIPWPTVPLGQAQLRPMIPHFKWLETWFPSKEQRQAGIGRQRKETCEVDARMGVVRKDPLSDPVCDRKDKKRAPVWSQFESGPFFLKRDW